MNKLEETIFNMFKENTGSSILDSGGAYGRNWEQNKDKTFKDFIKKPSAYISLYEHTDGEIDYYPITSTFHRMLDCLDLDELCNTFNNMPVEDWKGDYYGVSLDGMEYLESVELKPNETAWNTYNHENNFDVVLQGQFLTDADDNNYVLIQVHGGCDVRGGYTDAKLFKIEEPYHIFCDDMTCMLKEREDGSYLSIDWLGEWIGYEGSSLSEDEEKEAIEYFREVLKSGEDKVIGDLNETYS